MGNIQSGGEVHSVELDKRTSGIVAAVSKIAGIPIDRVVALAVLFGCETILDCCDKPDPKKNGLSHLRD